MMGFLKEKSFGLSFAIMRIAIFTTAIFFDIYVLKSDVELVFRYVDVLLIIHLILSFFLLFGYKYNILKYIFFILGLIIGNYFLLIVESLPVLASLLLILNLVVLLFPLNNTLSVDKLLSKKSLGLITIPKYYYTLFFIIWGLFYLDAAFYKLADYSNWLNDSGILLKKFFTFVPNLYNENSISQIVLNSKVLNALIASTTVVYQLFFLFTVFLLSEKTKHYFLVFGIFLHLGSAVIIDIWYLALLTIIFYIPFFNSRVFYKIFAFFRRKRKRLILIYDSGCSFCSKNIFLIKIFDFTNKIKLQGSDLSDEKEIILDYNSKLYKGVEAFKIVFKNVFLYYLAYLFLSISFIFNFFDREYKKFALNRKEFKCKINPPHIADYKYALLTITSIYVILTIFTKFGYFYEFKQKLSKIGFPIPAIMFLIRENHYIKPSVLYFKDENENRYFFNRVFWSDKEFFVKNSVIKIDDYKKLIDIKTHNKTYFYRVYNGEDKYVNGYLLKSFNDLKNKNRVNFILKNTSETLNKKLSICKKTMLLTFDEIRDLDVSKIDQKVQEKFYKTDEICLKY